MTAALARFALILLLATAAQAQSPRWEGARRDEARAAIAAEVKRQKAVGLAVGLIEAGQLVFLEGFGYEDREAQTPVDPEVTLFRWASISKPLTAVAALQLAAAGRLDLDADVRGAVPEFPDKGVRITARQLLCHQGGIVHYGNGPVIPTLREYEEEHPYESVILALDTFKASPLVAKPGEVYSYTTHGFILLSAVVERAGEARFADQVAERIARPCGMTTLRPDYQWLALPRRAVGYRERGGAVVRSTDTDVSWKLGGGGFVSSCGDLARFALGLMDDRLLSDEVKARAWTRQRTASGERTGYGLGFGVARSGVELRVSHSGGQEKTRTLLAIEPERGRGLVIMTNSEHVNPGAVAKVLWPLLEAAERPRARLY